MHTRAIFQMEDGMKSLAEAYGSVVNFCYHSIERRFLSAHIPTLQTSVAMARFPREVCGEHIPPGFGFKALTDRFVA
jgi:hypothetical protein